MGIEKENVFDESGFETVLNTFKIGPQQRTRLKEACAIAAYQQQTQCPIIEKLVCDDGRHYKKLQPIAPQHKEILKDFFTVTNRIFMLFYL